MVVNNNEEKVKDIRYEVSLGWADIKKRDIKWGDKIYSRESMRLWDKCWMVIMFFFKNILPVALLSMIVFYFYLLQLLLYYENHWTK